MTGASGTLRVTYDGKTVEYRSLAEMVQAKGMIERALNTAAGTGRATHFNPTYDHGLETPEAIAACAPRKVELAKGHGAPGKPSSGRISATGGRPVVAQEDGQ